MFGAVPFFAGGGNSKLAINQYSAVIQVAHRGFWVCGIHTWHYFQSQKWPIPEKYRFMELHDVLSSCSLSEFKSNMNQKLMKSVPKLGIESNLMGYESKVYWIGIFGICPSLSNDINDNDIQWMYLPQDCPAVTTLTDTIIHNSDASILIWPVKQTTGTITHYNNILLKWF